MFNKKKIVFFLAFIIGATNISGCTVNGDNDQVSKDKQEGYRKMNENVSKSLNSNRKDFSRAKPMPGLVVPDENTKR